MIELIVVIGIFVILSAILLVKFPVLGMQTRVNAAASEIIKQAKETMVNSVAVKELRTGIFPSYGIYFDTGTPNRFVIYADCVADDNADGTINNLDTFTYNPAATNCGGANGFVKNVDLDSRMKIKELRMISQGVTTLTNKAYVSFLRPEPSIWIANAAGTILDSGRLEVVVGDVSGIYEKRIAFWTTGGFEIIAGVIDENSFIIVP